MIKREEPFQSNIEKALYARIFSRRVVPATPDAAAKSLAISKY
jgi:hypothetical protein